MGKISRIEVKYIRTDTTRKELTYTMDEKEKKEAKSNTKTFHRIRGRKEIKSDTVLPFEAKEQKKSTSFPPSPLFQLLKGRAVREKELEETKKLAF